MSSFTPAFDRILVRPEEVEEVTSSGIVLPTQAQRRPNQGAVLAVGPGRYGESGQLIPVQFEVGTSVIYHQHSGVPVYVDGEELLCLSASEIIGSY